LLDIVSEITPFSYISKDQKYVFLEEDQDAITFINAAIKENWFSDYKEINSCTKEFITNSSSFIRNLNSFDAAQFQPEIKTDPVTTHKF